jgi:hypothetical protein
LTINIFAHIKYSVVFLQAYADPLLAALLAKDVFITAAPYLNGCVRSGNSKLSESY